MDDQNARSEFSRGATQEDLIELCRNLNNAGVKYVVIGGFAIIHWGYLRATSDIDLLVYDDKENMEKLLASMLYLPDKAAREVRPEDVTEYGVVRIADEIVVDLLRKACSVTWQAAKDHIENVETGGVSIPFLKPEMLLKTKETMRAKDAEDTRYLNELLKQRKQQSKKKNWWRW